VWVMLVDMTVMHRFHATCNLLRAQAVHLRTGGNKVLHWNVLLTVAPGRVREQAAPRRDNNTNPTALFTYTGSLPYVQVHA